MISFIRFLPPNDAFPAAINPGGHRSPIHSGFGFQQADQRYTAELPAGKDPQWSFPATGS